MTTNSSRPSRLLTTVAGLALAGAFALMSHAEAGALDPGKLVAGDKGEIAERAAPGTPQAPGPHAGRQSQMHVHNYGDFDQTCIRWTDHCRTCVRGSSDAAPVCSNIGIACQPEKVECTAR
jgi:hypothetical protein